MSNDFWTRKNIPQKSEPDGHIHDAIRYMGTDIDEEAMQIFVEDETIDLFEEEEEDNAFSMNDANLRLEQGRLYQMVLQGNIFADTNADPKAIRNVQREIHKFVRERMEVMLGIRQEQAKETVVSSPFNDMEVVVLKMLASKMSKGATEEEAPAPVPTAPKKDGISSISGNLRPKEMTPLRKEAKPIQRAPVVKKTVPTKSAIVPDDTLLNKPINEMTQEELVAYEQKAAERSTKKYATMPTNLVPHPSASSLEMMYTQQAAMGPAPGSAVTKMMDMINGR